MNNQAKLLKGGISGLGEKIAISRTGFRSPIVREDRGQWKRVVDEERLPELERVAEEQPVVGSPESGTKKSSSGFERITFEIEPEQRANLSNVANTLNFRVPRSQRTQKINRDMVMRALLTVAERIDWDAAQGIITEDDLKAFVSAQVVVDKKTADKVG